MVNCVTPAKTHIPEEMLAALVEGGLTGEEYRLTREHLTGCRVCMAAYADAVRLRSSWQLETTAATADAYPSRTAGFGSRTTRLVLAACLPLVIAATAWLGLRGGEGAYPGQDLLLPVLARASHHGPILPGAGSAAWQPTVLTRSGGGDRSTGDGIRDLLDDLQTSERDSWAAASIAGYLALDDDRQMARIRVDRELAEGNDHPDLLVTAGILAYRESYLTEARHYFESALESRPDDPVARFNLALVLSESGHSAAAGDLFQDLTGLGDHPLISHRAAQELARLADLQPTD